MLFFTKIDKVDSTVASESEYSITDYKYND